MDWKLEKRAMKFYFLLFDFRNHFPNLCLRSIYSPKLNRSAQVIVCFFERSDQA